VTDIAPTPKRTRKRRTNAERMPDVLGMMNADALYALGVAFAKAHPMSADILSRGIHEGQAPDVHDMGIER